MCQSRDRYSARRESWRRTHYCNLNRPAVGAHTVAVLRGGIEPTVTIRGDIFAAVVPICVQPVVPSGDRSILKLVSLSELSVQDKSICRPAVGVAVSKVGAAGGVGGAILNGAPATKVGPLVGTRECAQRTVDGRAAAFPHAPTRDETAAGSDLLIDGGHDLGLESRVIPDAGFVENSLEKPGC